jgi:hypothetical protein
VFGKGTDVGARPSVKEVMWNYLLSGITVIRGIVA